MKKNLLLILGALVFVATISSCKKTYVNAANTNTTVLRTISPNAWVFDQTEGAYRVDLSIPQLDETYNDDGAVLVYVSYGLSGNQAPVYEQLPQVYQGISFSYYHTDGRVVIFSQTSGGNPGPAPDQNLTVKVVLIDSVPEP